MKPTVAVLTTLDTKGVEARYLADQVETLGGAALLIDLGVLGEPATKPDVDRATVARAGGSELETLLRSPSRQVAGPVMVAGATKWLLEAREADRVQAVVGLGGTQGTSSCTAVMQSLPYGFPKLMVSTVASGDTSAFVGIKDITMMFSVGDLLGLNPVTRKILANAAAAAWGMASSKVALEPRTGDRPVIGMTNLGVLTEGAMRALERFGTAGYEVIVFHAVGSGGRAMEQMMREGLIGAVFDYALGEIADELFEGLRAGDAQRLTVAGELGLPQVICPGGAEHVGLLTEPNVVPAAWADHASVFHSPIIVAVRLNAGEMRRLAREVNRRLGHTKGRACLLLPLGGTSRYAIAGGELHDPEADRAFREELAAGLPPGIELVERELTAEDPVFVDEAVDRLRAMIEE